ncbi:DUF4381 domain-containing protein [Gilvimarinus chinensis]|uniref:DUF4381 domain-containing protein n=1 Tax=Gilvimarinus chinensis TaxID=396005 RepID=UPI000382DF68|nr:DUF4381 domain-containing protein [Gilvimarinus chinensis]
MNPSDPLAQLNDIHTPDAIGWWPLAPLWWVIIALTITLLVVIVMVLIRKYQAQQYRRDALAELNNLPRDDDNQTFALKLNTLLKRTAITAYGEGTCATLHGEHWLAFLQKSAPKLNVDTAQPLADAAYKANPQFDQNTLRHYATQWLKQHRRKRKFTPEAKHV